jgi:two-component system LytT family response regulator
MESGTDRRMLLRTTQGLVIVIPRDVQWIEAKEGFSLMHCKEGDHLVRFRFHTLEKRLDPRQFIRIHRSIIVNVDNIHSIRRSPNRGFRVTLKQGPELDWSRRYANRLRSIEKDSLVLPVRSKCSDISRSKLNSVFEHFESRQAAK